MEKSDQPQPTAFGRDEVRAERIVAAAIEWFRAGEELTAERRKERSQILSRNRAYTETQLRLRSAIEEYVRHG